MTILGSLFGLPPTFFASATVPGAAPPPEQQLPTDSPFAPRCVAWAAGASSKKLIEHGVAGEDAIADGGGVGSLALGSPATGRPRGPACRPQSAAAEPQAASASTSAAARASASGWRESGATCLTCGIGVGCPGFSSPQEQRQHFKTDWHRCGCTGVK